MSTAPPFLPESLAEIANSNNINTNNINFDINNSLFDSIDSPFSISSLSADSPASANNHLSPHSSAVNSPQASSNTSYNSQKQVEEGVSQHNHRHPSSSSSITLDSGSHIDSINNNTTNKSLHHNHNFNSSSSSSGITTADISSSLDSDKTAQASSLSRMRHNMSGAAPSPSTLTSSFSHHNSPSSPNNINNYNDSTTSASSTTNAKSRPDMFRSPSYASSLGDTLSDAFPPPPISDTASSSNTSISTNNNTNNNETDLAAQLSRDDPLATQVWKYFVRAKSSTGGTHNARMENLSWRMGGMKLEHIRSQQDFRGRSASPPSTFQPLSPATLNSFTSVTTKTPPNSSTNTPTTTTTTTTQNHKHSSSSSSSSSNNNALSSFEESRGRERLPRSLGSSSDSRDQTVTGLRSTNNQNHTTNSSRREPSSDAMDWRNSSRSRSRPPLSRIPEPTPPTSALSLDQSTNPTFSIADINPDTLAASLGLSPKSSGHPSPHSAGHPHHSSMDEQQALFDAFGQLVSNQSASSSTESFKPTLSYDSPEPMPWPSSCPPTSYLSDPSFNPADHHPLKNESSSTANQTTTSTENGNGNGNDGENPDDENKIEDDDDEFAEKLLLFTNDEGARQHRKTMGSIPGLFNERDLKQNQHSEYGFLPRLVRKTSFDERPTPERPENQNRTGRNPAITSARNSDLRRPSPARPVVQPGRKRPVEATIRALSPLRSASFDADGNGATLPPRALAGRLEAANRRSRNNTNSKTNHVPSSSFDFAIPTSSSSPAHSPSSILESASNNNTSSSNNNNNNTASNINPASDNDFLVRAMNNVPELSSDSYSTLSSVPSSSVLSFNNNHNNQFTSSSQPHSTSASGASTPYELDPTTAASLNNLSTSPKDINNIFGVNPHQVVHPAQNFTSSRPSTGGVGSGGGQSGPVPINGNHHHLQHNHQQQQQNISSSLPVDFSFNFAGIRSATSMSSSIGNENSPITNSSTPQLGNPLSQQHPVHHHHHHHHLPPQSHPHSQQHPPPTHPLPPQQHHSYSSWNDQASTIHSSTPSPINTEPSVSYKPPGPPASYHPPPLNHAPTTNPHYQQQQHQQQSYMQHPQQLPFHPLIPPTSGAFVDFSSHPSSVGSSPSSTGDASGNTPNNNQSVASPPKKVEASVCYNCHTSNTPLWRRDESGKPLCNSCGLYLKLHGIPRPLSLATGVIKKRNRGRGKADTSSSSSK